MMNMIFGGNEWGNYIRINKTEARKLHAQGEDIYMVPCKMSPINCWGLCYNKSFQDMYETCLRIAKNNKFKVNYYEEFNARWYDIMFINIEEYAGVERFGLNKNI